MTDPPAIRPESSEPCRPSGDAQEEVLAFECEGEPLWGILHRPAHPARRAVLVVVGGPQTRVGSHRQFVMLARALAARGFAVLRFDYRGMGDSGGDRRDFEAVEADVAAGVDALLRAVPEAAEVVLWGLCDAASAALFYAGSDPRVSGAVLANPWVRSGQGIARSYLKRYYLQRLLSPDLWRKIRRGELDYRDSLRSLAATLASAAGLGRDRDGGPGAASHRGEPPPASGGESGPARAALLTGPAAITRQHDEPLAARMLAGLERFTGRSLFILSGNDLTAGEFDDAVGASRRWRRAMRGSRVTVRRFPPADHTFSTRAWRDQVASWTADWLESW